MLATSLLSPLPFLWASLVAQTVKHLPVMRETWVLSLGREDLLEKGMATHSSILVSPPRKKGAQRNIWGFSSSSDGKASAYKAEDLDSIPGLGRSP